MDKKKTGSKITLLMTIAVLSGFAIILAMNIAAMLGVIPSKYISPNDVRGMAVEHGGLLYTLNFEQQNTLVDSFNRFIPITKDTFEKRKLKDPLPEVSKIIIYRFNEPDIIVTPIGYIAKSSSVTSASSNDQMNLVFTSLEWNKTGYLEESAVDEIRRVLQTSYDP